MNDSLQRTVSDVLDYLLYVQREGLKPEAARAALRAVRQRHGELEIDLLAEEQAFDATYHYDALIRRTGEGTVSLSYCPERAVPWPLRGVHRWHDGDLVRVNDNLLQVDAAMACLDFIWDEAPIIDRLVHTCLIQNELEHNPITLSDDELQLAMDKFRAAKKLYKAEDTLRWLERHGMTREKLEKYVSQSAIVPKLRERVSAGRIEPYFDQNLREFESARVARLEFPNEGTAREYLELILAGKDDLFGVAERLFFEAAERGRPSKNNLFAMIQRRDADAGLREVLFSAATGEIVQYGPTLIRVLSFVPARLDDRTRAAIREILFKEWLEERREAATIEWFWGNAKAE